MPLSFPVLSLLVAVAFAAGFVDSIAGGGGLLSLPALLAAGLPPHLALGTNKGQSVFGSAAATVRYAGAGVVDRRRAIAAFPFAFLGALAGAWLVLRLRSDLLRPLVIVLLVGAAAVLVVRRPEEGVREPLIRAVLPGAAVIAFLLGGYDGFFGPGTGTFLLIAHTMLLGDSIARGTGAAKLVNFASNLASVVLFAARGVIVWKIALPMAAAQTAGGWLGAHVAVRKGDRFIRGVVLAVVAVLVGKLTLDGLRSP